ncbi:MAG: hypothetical protein QOK09_1661, partial [Mycobacterium sp.]|nr:hypothetical protein [Mycobacterium sp.]
RTCAICAIPGPPPIKGSNPSLNSYSDYYNVE